MNELDDQEKHLYVLQRQKITQLEKQLKINELKLIDINTQYTQLHSNYEHNLQVINDRDLELDEVTEQLLKLKMQYDTQLNEYIQLEATLHNKQEEWLQQRNDLKNKIDEQRKEIKYLKRIHEEELQNYQAKYKITLTQNETLKNEKQQFKNQQNQIDLLQQQLQQQQQKIQEQKDIILNLEKEQQKQQELVQDNNILQNKINQLKQLHNDQINEYQNDIQLLKLKLQQQTQIIEQLKKDQDDIQGQESINYNKLQSKIIQLQQDKQDLEYKLLELKQKKKNKLKLLKDEGQKQYHNLQQQSDDKIKKLEYNNQQLTIEKEKLTIQEQNLKEKLQEIEAKLNRTTFDFESRIEQLIKNNEQDKKQHKNEIEHKVFQINQQNEEITSLKQTISESNRLLDNLASKIQELRNENKILVEELTTTKKHTNTHTEKKQQQQSNNQGVQHSNKGKMKFLDDEEEVESVERLFSGDEGPVSSLMYKGSLQQVKLSKQSMSKQMDNVQLRLLIKDMTLTMESTRHQLELKYKEVELLKSEIQQNQDKIQQQKQENLQLKEQILRLKQQQQNQEELENINKELREQLEGITKKLQNSKEMIMKLKQEREHLLEITSELNQKLKENDHQEELIQMQTEIKYLQNQLKYMKDEIPINQKSYTLSEIQNQLK